MASTASNTAPIPLQVDIEYIDAAQDACVSWLKGKYASLLPAATAAAAPARRALHGSQDGAEPTGKTKLKKPQLDRAVLQRLENDIAACDALRWRVFAFPSHPTKALNANYRNEPGTKDKASALIAQMHKVKKTERSDSSEAPKPSDDKNSTAPSHYALVVSTRASADATAKDKKKRVKKGNGSASTPLTPPKMDELMERLVLEEERARQCRLLGEENVVFGDQPPTPAEPAGAHAPSWMHRWLPRSWRPQFGGYVVAPDSTGGARLLLFPQSAHPAVDFRDPAAPQLPPGTSLSDPQRVPYYVRGRVSWDVEKNNPAAGTGDAVSPDSHRAPAGTPQISPGLSCSVHAAKINPAPSNPHQQHNWVDRVDVSLAARQSRTERRYAPDRDKVQRVTLLENSAAVRVNQGNPRYSTSFTAAHATVPNSGARHSREVSPDFSFKRERVPGRLFPTAAVEDDCVDRLQLQDDYDSSVQAFALPTFWQRLVRPSLKRSESSGAAETGTGTQVLDAVPRGQYRVRWSGGPGVEVCRSGSHAQVQKVGPPSSSLTFFGKLWTESWLEVPLPWQLALKLRTQSAVVMPLEYSKPLAPPMVSSTTAVTAPAAAAAVYASPSMGGNTEEEGGSRTQLREHHYFWATQGPRWDAALVRGFKNDYSGMHHARRWYSLLSAELTLNGDAKEGSGKSADCISDEDTAAATPRRAAPSRWQNTSLTAFANACMVDTVKDYPRASVGVSFTSKIPRISITPFNEIIPHKFECSFSWFAAFKPNTGDAGGNGRGFNVEFMSGVQPQHGGGTAAMTADGMPLLRVSPVETFQHMKCGLTWKFDG
ncbi:hypothetical protein ABL78_0525 [Leptomonas seymouri]|uniref:Uncharacterized protein n=1 Tax=Leptomonas seymouri TaxID=5684 RepID=A0A0N0P8T0_LEPSE|nr:hypothetical protein ABL78_0525 [Leptomonas seymouri]|eukprot:KPI90299.1 hypothetical protein ABL78_0525 [Leptomonas seymouri]